MTSQRPRWNCSEGPRELMRGFYYFWDILTHWNWVKWEKSATCHLGRITCINSEKNEWPWHARESLDSGNYVCRSPHKFTWMHLFSSTKFKNTFSKSKDMKSFKNSGKETKSYPVKQNGVSKSCPGTACWCFKTMQDQGYTGTSQLES